MTTEDLPETRFAQSGEASIAYQVFGDGPVDMVFVPGIISFIDWAWDLPDYTDFFRRLARFGRVATFDKRGQGASDRISGAPTLEERADDVRAVMDAIGMQRAALIAHSEGAAMGAYFAAAFPERVTHLVLHGGIPKFARSDDYPYGPTEEQLQNTVDQWGTGRLMKFAYSVFDDPAMQATAARFERQACGPGNFKALVELNAKLDVRNVLPGIRRPTLVLHNTGDRLAPIEGGRYFAEHIPGAKLIEYDSAEHVFCAGDYARTCSDIEEFVTGVRHDADEASDRVLATVLFTDIVDSTMRASAAGDAAWSRTLGEHDRIVRSLVERHRGRVIKMTGDGVLATFDGPGRAIRCALGMNSALARLNLEIRAGLHTGEVEDRGDDISGIAVHAASRVMDMAAQGEVLVSRVVADLVAGSGIAFTDRGETELKGLSGSWRLLAASG